MRDCRVQGGKSGRRHATILRRLAGVISLVMLLAGGTVSSLAQETSDAAYLLTLQEAI